MPCGPARKRSFRTSPADSSNWPRSAKCTVIQARATFEDSQTLQARRGRSVDLRGNRLTFEHCILASGSIPAMPSAFKLPTDRVMDSTGALELADVPESLLVIGGGYIGLEMGTVYAELGSKVSVVELTPTLLPLADRDLVKPLQDRLNKIFAAIYLETKVVSLADQGNAIEVGFEDAKGRRSEKFSRVLVSVGRRPEQRRAGTGKHPGRARRQGLRHHRRSAAHGRSAHFGDRRRGRRADAGAQGDARGQSRGRGPAGRAGRLRIRRPFRPSCSPIPKSPGPA